MDRGLTAARDVLSRVIEWREGSSPGDRRGDCPTSQMIRTWAQGSGRGQVQNRLCCICPDRSRDRCVLNDLRRRHELRSADGTGCVKCFSYEQLSDGDLFRSFVKLGILNQFRRRLVVNINKRCDAFF